MAGVDAEPGKERQVRGMVSDRVLELASAKGAPHAEQMDGFEKTRLAAAVGADNEIDTRRWLDSHRPEISQTIDF